MNYKVSIVKCNSYNSQEVRESLIQSLKDIDFNFKKNMKVLIKPNILGPYPPEKAVTTHPVVIEELCKILKKYNAKIIIGESSAYNTNQSFEVSGIKKLSKYAEILNFESVPKKVFNINNIKIPLPKILFEVDLIINMAKLKTHCFTKVTLASKNLYGCIPGKLKSLIHKKFPLEKDLSKVIFELNKIIKPQLNIIDGILGMEGEGPGTSGTPINSNLIISGKNNFAVDIIASEVMGFNPYNIYTNKFSKIKKEDIKIIGSKNINLNFKKAKLTNLSFLSIFNILFPKPKIFFNHKKCTQCHVCEEKCPVQAITLKPYPICNHKTCVRCLCCIEVCPSNAIYLKENKIKETLKKFIEKFS